MGSAVRPLLLGVIVLLLLGMAGLRSGPVATTPEPVLVAKTPVLVAKTPVLVAKASALGSKASGVPWTAGEKLSYSLAWQGILVGELRFAAEPTPEGWRYTGKLEPQGLGLLLGYGLEAQSQVGSNLYTNEFHKDLIEPGKGTTRLESEVGESGVKTTIINPDGKRTGWKSSAQEVLDDLSILYFLRARPELKQVSVVDYPKLAQGRVENLGRNAEGLSGYRFAQDGLNIEMWFRSDARRTPARMYFTRDFGRIEGNLLENKQ
jgi:hypothetical protein